MKNKYLYTFLVTSFFLQISGCTLWVPYESRYLINSPNHDIKNEEYLENIVFFLESYFKSKGMTIQKKYREIYPDDFRVMVFEFVDGKKVKDKTVKRPSLCVQTLGARQIKVSYRI